MEEPRSQNFPLSELWNIRNDGFPFTLRSNWISRKELEDLEAPSTLYREPHDFPWETRRTTPHKYGSPRFQRLVTTPSDQVQFDGSHVLIHRRSDRHRGCLRTGRSRSRTFSTPSKVLVGVLGLLLSPGGVISVLSLLGWLNPLIWLGWLSRLPALLPWTILNPLAVEAESTIAVATTVRFARAQRIST